MNLNSEFGEFKVLFSRLVFSRFQSLYVFLFIVKIHLFFVLDYPYGRK